MDQKLREDAIRLYMDLYTPEEIFRELDGLLTKDQIKYVVKPFRPARDENRKSRIKTMAEGGMSIPHICHRVRMAPKSVKETIQALGITRKWTHESGWGMELTLPYFDNPESALSELAERMELSPGHHLFVSHGKTCRVSVRGRKTHTITPIVADAEPQKTSRAEVAAAFVRSGNFEGLRSLIADGFSVKDASYAFDRTLLFHARSLSMIKYLVDICGLDLYHEDKYGRNVYRHLISEKYEDVAASVRTLMTSKEF